MNSPDDLVRRGDVLADVSNAINIILRDLPAAPLPDDVVDLLRRVSRSPSVSPLIQREATHLLGRRALNAGPLRTRGAGDEER